MEGDLGVRRGCYLLHYHENKIYICSEHLAMITDTLRNFYWSLSANPTHFELVLTEWCRHFRTKHQYEVGSETQKYYRPHGIPYSTSTLVHSYHCFPKPLSTFPNGRIMDSSKRTRSELNTINNLCTINPAGPIFIAFFKSKSLITKMSCLFYGTNMLRDWKNV